MNITPSWVQVHPSFMMPELLLQYNQASGAQELLFGANPQVRLGDGDLLVYVRAFDIRTIMQSQQASANQLPSVSITARMISTPTYLNRVRAEYDHHDTAASGQWGMSIVEAQRLGMRQGHFQLMRDMLLYGQNPANGEGLLNAPGATTVNLPPDSNGSTTVLTYDNGEMAFFLLGQVNALKGRTFNLGMPGRIVITGPQRVLGNWEYQDIVQVTQYQRQGAGSLSTAGVVKAVLEMNQDEVEFTYDDTLIGKGAGGADAIVMTLPEVKKPVGNSMSTNEWAKIAPGLDACNIQLCDMAAPREIPTPLPGGAIDVVSEMRSTSGWGLRPQALTIISMPY